MGCQMTLTELLAITGDHHEVLPSGAVLVNPRTITTHYWTVDDYAVSSVASGQIVLVPRRPLGRRPITLPSKPENLSAFLMDLARLAAPQPQTWTPTEQP